MGTLDVKSAINITSGKAASYPISTISMKYYFWYQSTSALTKHTPILWVLILVINAFVNIFAPYKQDSPVKYII